MRTSIISRLEVLEVSLKPRQTIEFLHEDRPEDVLRMEQIKREKLPVKIIRIVVIREGSEEFKRIQQGRKRQ